MNRKNINFGLIFRRAIFFGFLLLIWEFLVLMKIWPEYIFPSPMSVYKALYYGFSENSYLKAIFNSMKTIAVGYTISVVCGITLGVLMGRIKMLDETLGCLVLGIQALPSICWLPLSLIWFGLNENAIIFVVVMGALFSITIGVETGVKNTPHQFVYAAKTLGSKGFSLYYRVIIPAAMPSIFSGLKQGWSFAWRSLMAGELLFYSLSLGNLLQTGRELNDVPQVMSVMLVIMFLGASVDRFVFSPILNHTRKKWGF